MSQREPDALLEWRPRVVCTGGCGTARVLGPNAKLAQPWNDFFARAFGGGVGLCLGSYLLGGRTRLLCRFGSRLLGLGLLLRVDPLRSRRFALAVHEISTERALGFELIVGTAAKPDVGYGRKAASRHGLDVIELDELARLAAVAGVADERAAAAVALVDGAANVGGDVASRG
jgi:hypothetical protein